MMTAADLARIQGRPVRDPGTPNPRAALRARLLRVIETLADLRLGMPSHAELARFLAVSQNDLGTALGELHARGEARREQGRGRDSRIVLPCGAATDWASAWPTFGWLTPEPVARLREAAGVPLRHVRGVEVPPGGG